MDTNNKTKTHNWFLHIDLDAFFASVEQLDHPEYRGKPVIVGGTKEDKRGVVSTASYEARKYGIHSAMPIFKAIKLCPNGIYVRGRMSRYAELSYKIMNIFKEFSPDVDQMSIDEAFVDLTGTEQLFGPPEQTALKVKKRVKELTGLTVSIGLATTKYLAKIASGYSKPDGFYFVRPGKEQDFMLALPLKKVWGLGPKALEKLNKSGINTTKDIYEKQFDLLDFLFGTNMATFLYNVVRGIEKESFTRKPKSHSISAERTFSCDIMDLYTAETELLELAHGVIFRLLKEESFSRTIAVKIKYDDFTTVSIQKTYDNNIMTLDSFYENAKSLFEEKYQEGRRIRLLGIGFEKVENEDRPHQQSLFIDDEYKKNAVEKAILNINKKHPDIQIKKARLLKSISIIFFLFCTVLIFSTSQPLLSAEEQTVTIKGAGSLMPEKVTDSEKNINEVQNIEKSSGSIYSWNINDNNKVNFNLTGFWNGQLCGSFLSSFGNNTPFTFKPTVPIFKQDIEMSALLTINNQWFFEGSFADNFNNNTIAMGYTGTNYFRAARLSNRNITMPDIYSASEFGYSLTGGTNQAPGFSAHWQSPTNKWSADFLLRYDMTLPKSITYYGMNQLQEKTINIENFVYGLIFTFPKSSTDCFKELKNIYVENIEGNYTDSEGKSYKKLSSSQYYYSNENNNLYLSPLAEGNKKNGKVPTILITFNSNTIPEQIINDSGSYDDKNTFLGKIQNLFNKNSGNYNLIDYTYNLTTTIENADALKIQNSEGFSPYIVASTYDCGTINNNEITVVFNTTGNIIDKYIAEIQNNFPIENQKDFFNINHFYATILNTATNNNQYPLADSSPEIYLNLKQKNDISLKVRNFTPVSQINIGQNISPGTVQIYKNGSFYTDYIYDNKTGNIQLSDKINSTDIIKIYYQEESSNFSQGIMSLGVGYFMNILPALNWDISLTAQYPLILKDTLVTVDNLQNSFLALSSGINYKADNLNLTDKLSLSLMKANPYNQLLVSTQSDFTPKTFYLDYYSGTKTNVTPILYTNTIKQIKLLPENNRTIGNHNGEEDDKEKGYKIPLEWKFLNNNNKEPLWAAVDIKLNEGTKLKNSSKLNLKIKLEEPIEYNSADLYIQLGIKAGTEGNNETRIITYKITNENSFDYNSTAWQEISIDIKDRDRPFLISNYDIRFIVVQNNSKSQSGKLYIGSYTPIEESIITSSDNSIIITTSSEPSDTKFFSSVVNWKLPENIDKNTSEISAASYFSPADFNIYKKINFKFAYKKNDSKINNTINTDSLLPELTIILDSESLSINNIGKEAIKIKLFNIDDYISESKIYHKLTVDLQTKKLFIDNEELDSNSFLLEINSNIIPSRVIYKINPVATNEIITSGSFYSDNITYEINDISYLFQNYLNGTYNKNEIIKIKQFNLINDLFIKIATKQKVTPDNFSIFSNLNTGISIAGIKFEGDISLNQLSILNGGHIVKTNTPIFNVISFEENYRWNNKDKIMNKINYFDLNFHQFKIPLQISLNSSAINNNILRNHNNEAMLSSNFNIKDIGLNISSKINNLEDINLIKNQNILYPFNNYFLSWYDLSKYQFSWGDIHASSRKINFENSIKLTLPDNNMATELKYKLLGAYVNKDFITFSDKEIISLELPFSIKNNFIKIKMEKTAGKNTNTPISDSYSTDYNNLFNIQKERIYFYKSIPFYDLVDKNIKNELKGNYSTKYELLYKKKMFNDFRDIFIPSSFELSVIRELNKDTNLSDNYQIKSVITNTSINNFGKNSIKQLFKWFNQEEIITSITTLLNIPTDCIENISYDISTYIQILFMINDNSILSTAFDYTINSNKNWNTKGTFIYKRPGTNSFIIDLTQLIIKKSNEIDFKITRNDNFNYEIGYSNKILKQQYDYNHSLDISFLENYTISTGTGITFCHIENKASSLTLNYSIGAKIRF